MTAICLTGCISSTRQEVCKVNWLVSAGCFFKIRSHRYLGLYLCILKKQGWKLSCHWSIRWGLYCSLFSSGGYPQILSQSHIPSSRKFSSQQMWAVVLMHVWGIGSSTALLRCWSQNQEVKVELFQLKCIYKAFQFWKCVFCQRHVLWYLPSQLLQMGCCD